MVRHFAEEGGYVAVLDRNDKAVYDLADTICKAGGCTSAYHVDVLEKKSLNICYDQAMNRFGRIDVLINAAGGNMPGVTIAPDRTFFYLDSEAVHKVVDLNLFGTILSTLVFAKAMTEQGSGSIINIASESALRPLTRATGYGTAKAVVVNFTRYMYGELATKFGPVLRVNALEFFLTEQNRQLLIHPDGSLIERAHTPFGRFGEPEELLGTQQWLASDASRFVSGTLTVIDGEFNALYKYRKTEQRCIHVNNPGAGTVHLIPLACGISAKPKPPMWSMHFTISPTVRLVRGRDRTQEKAHRRIRPAVECCGKRSGS